MIHIKDVILNAEHELPCRANDFVKVKEVLAKRFGFATPIYTTILAENVVRYQSSDFDTAYTAVVYE